MARSEKPSKLNIIAMPTNPAGKQGNIKEKMHTHTHTHTHTQREREREREREKKLHYRGFPRAGSHGSPQSVGKETLTLTSPRMKNSAGTSTYKIGATHHF
jgi:hypothetical protein